MIGVFFLVRLLNFFWTNATVPAFRQVTRGGHFPKTGLATLPANYLYSSVTQFSRKFLSLPFYRRLRIRQYRIEVDAEVNFVLLRTADNADFV